MNVNVFSDTRAATYAGLTGGLLFLTKAFALPFFIFLFTVAATLNYRRKNLQLKHTMFLMLTWLIICGAWITVLSFHYGQITVSKSATFNNSLTVRMLAGQEKLPVLRGGIIKPRPYQLSAWEEPGEYQDEKSNPATWNERISRNLLSIYYNDIRHQAGALFLILLAFAVIKRKNLFSSDWLLFCICCISGIYFGYSLILVHGRYTWTAYLLMIAVSATIISSLSNESIRRLTFILFIIFILKRPVKEILFITDKPVTAGEFTGSLLHPLSMLKNTYQPDRQIHSLIEKIRSHNKTGGELAAGDKTFFKRDPYAAGLRISEAAGMTFLGTFPAGEKDFYLKKFPRLHYMQFVPDGSINFITDTDTISVNRITFD
jgi:hypothetical protein